MAEKVVTVRRHPDMTAEEYAGAKRKATKGATITHVTVVPGLVSGSTTYTLEKPEEKEEPPAEEPPEEIPEEPAEENLRRRMTRVELDEIAESKGLNPDDYANKAEIRAAIVSV